MKHVILQLANQQPHCHLAMVSTEGVETLYQLPLEQLRYHIQRQKCTILVPGETVRLTQLNIAKTSTSQLAKAVPYALEETTIEDIDSLHFAIGKYNNQGQLAVAITQRHLMDEWKTQLQQQPIKSETMLPEYLALPWQADHWHLLLSCDKAWVRTGKDSGFCINREHLVPLLALRFKEGEPLPVMIDLNYTEPAAAPTDDFLQGLGIPLQRSEHAIDRFTLFSQGLSQQTSINLLQAGYHLNKNELNGSRLWRACFYLGVAFCLLWIVAQITQMVILSNRSQQLTTQINQLYYQVFPHAQSVISPRLRIERALQSGLSRNTGGRFLGPLFIMGQTLSSENNAIQINNLDFETEQLHLSPTATNFAMLNRFTAALKAKGLTVTERDAHTQDNQVKAQLSIGSPS